MKKLFVLSMAALTLSNQMLWACWPSPEAAELISANEKTSQVYGWYNLVLAIVVAATRFLRAKPGTSAYVLLAGLVGLVAISPGWHYDWTHGDCGMMQAVFSKQILAVLGVLFLWQLGLATYQFWQSKFRRPLSAD